LVTKTIQIVVDQSWTTQLQNVIEVCYIVNPTGKRLGMFCPEVDPGLYEGLEPSWSEEELTRREQAGGGRSLRAILADLEKRAG